MIPDTLTAGDKSVHRVARRVAVTKDCIVDGASTLIYKRFSTNSVKLITVLETTTGKSIQFEVPSKAKTPVLMSSWICVPCSDGEIILYALDGSKRFSHVIPETAISDTVRISDMQLGVVGVTWKEDKKAFEVTIKLVRLDDAEMDVTTLGIVPPKGGTLVSPDRTTLWWLVDKESRYFAISPWAPKNGRPGKVEATK